MGRILYGMAAAVMVVIMGSPSALARILDNVYEDEGLVVTAQKQREHIREVPVSMEVFTGERLEEAEIRNTAEMLRHTPNLHMKDSGADHVIVIRGVSSYPNSLTSPAGYYVDDIAYPLQVMHNTDFFDVERVEVLRGPQGTLYGKNSESGLIHVITRAPDDTLRGRLRLGYGNYNTWEGGVSVSGPVLQDRLYAGVQVLGIKSDGFVENMYSGNDKSGSRERVSGRVRLRWTPNDAWELEYLADALHHDDGNGIFRFYEAGDAGDFTTPPHTINQDVDNQYKEETASTHSLRLKHAGESFDMTLITGFQEYKMDFLVDAFIKPTNDGTWLYSYGSRQTMTELRLSSPVTADRVKWLVGVSASSEEQKVNADGGDPSGERYYWRRVDIDIVSQAIFGQATWRFADRWYLTGGGRFDFQTAKGVLSDRSIYAFMNADTTDDLSNREFLPKAALRFAVTDDVSIYTSVAKGFMAGGINAWANLGVPDSGRYSPEYTWNYEVGMKGRFLDRRLDVETALFYIDIKDKQVSDTNKDMQTYIRNAASATSWGGELSFTARILPGFDVFGGMGVTQSEIEKWKTYEQDSGGNVVALDYSGKKLQNVPEYTVCLGAQYRHASGLMARVDVHGVGEFYGDPKNSTRQEAYRLLNAKIGYETEAWDISLWGKNLTDETYATYIAPYKGAAGELVGNSAKDGDPLTFGVTVNLRY
ncbi:TonB-dependent receptor [Desulfobotulus sp. H1]|uniref:TonB-dependent receptor n=1 Tax=Desulfobotulus pelophilus TaxID=2823377 RepID=A0ABT3N7N4_9BACT|nr:TonB-dependent receptor [Desulfobotulus pelophilus]MCW7753474.1 TonB-dependent receptor [Desulfobotulus pelophilus]